LTYEAVIAAYELENRSLSYFLIDPRKLATPPSPCPPARSAARSRAPSAMR
jgi:hypothetical protein